MGNTTSATQQRPVNPLSNKGIQESLELERKFLRFVNIPEHQKELKLAESEIRMRSMRYFVLATFGKIDDEDDVDAGDTYCEGCGMPVYLCEC